MISELEKELNNIQTIPVNSDELVASTSEEDFMALGFDLLVEVGSYVCVAACVLPGNTKCWNRNQAIIGGNIVRLFKLISALLDQTCQRRREISFILTRLAFETIVNITYLIKFASPKLFDSYVRYSLRHERKLLGRIQENIKDRGGEELPIERRMLNSLERTANRSKISLADISPNKPKNWGDKNIFERAKEVELEDAYFAAIGGGSHTVHGNWMDLLEYHIEDEGEGFKPHLEWRNPRPQPLFMIARLATESMGHYFDFLGDEQIVECADRKLVNVKLANLLNRIVTADEAHESFLTSRMGGENA